MAVGTTLFRLQGLAMPLRRADGAASSRHMHFVELLEGLECTVGTTCRRDGARFLPKTETEANPISLKYSATPGL